MTEPNDTPAESAATTADPASRETEPGYAPLSWLHLPTIAGIALAVGVAQLVAATTLELSSPRQLSAAQATGPIALWWLLASVVLGSASVYAMRARPPRALLSAVLWVVATSFGVIRGGHGRDLAFYGEPVAYHLLAIVSTVLIWGTTWRWVADRELGGRRRTLPAVLACSAAAILLLEHLGSSIPALEGLARVTIFSGVARMLALLSWPAALWVMWPKLREVPARWVPLLGSVLLTVRVAAAGPSGLVGGTVSGTGVSILGAAFVIVAMATAVAMRPRLGLFVHLLLGTVSLGACMLFLSVYYSGYGSLEDGLSGILRSLFGFDVPLPFNDQPGWWHPAVVMVGIFFLFYAAYASIVSTEDRRKGVGLALMLLAGLNLLSPYLVLMLTAGGLFLVDAVLIEARARDAAQQDAASANAWELLHQLASRLGIEEPVRIAGRRGEVLKLFGTLSSRPLELLIRITPGKASSAELMAGVLGRGDPVMSLIPDPGTRGERPSHLLARSHRLKGEVRMLESLGEQPLDAMMPFGDTQMDVWEGGVLCQLGASCDAASIDEIEALVRAAVRTASSTS